MLPLLLPLLALPSIAAAKEEKCEYTSGRVEDRCINSRASVATEFSFPPIFPDGAKFVYAVDDLNPDELMVLAPAPSRKSVENLKASMNAWWLEYDSRELDTAEFLMNTDMYVLLTNETASNADSAKGCEAVLGAACLDELEVALQDHWEAGYRAHSTPIQDLANDEARKETLKSCPEDLFKAGAGPRSIEGLGGFLIAVETSPESSIDSPHREAAVYPAGNASAPYSNKVFPGQSLPTLIGQTAVAVLMRYPNSLIDSNYTARQPTKSDVTVQFVCAKIEDDGSYDAEESQADDEGAATLVGVPNMLLSSLVVAALWAWI